MQVIGEIFHYHRENVQNYCIVPANVILFGSLWHVAILSHPIRTPHYYYLRSYTA